MPINRYRIKESIRKITAIWLKSLKNPRYAIVDVDREMRLRDALDRLSELDREVLARFYLREQSPETICRDLGLTDQEFCNIKRAAKAAVMGKLRSASAKGDISRGEDIS